MMYEVDKHGLIATNSSLSQYDSIESIRESLNLPKPNSNLIIDSESYERIYNDKGEIANDAQIPEDYIELPKHLMQNPLFEGLLIRHGINLIEDVQGTPVLIDSWSTLSDKVDQMDGVSKLRFYRDLLNVLAEFSGGKKLVYVQEYFGLNSQDRSTNLEQLQQLMSDEFYGSFEKIKLFRDLNKHNSSRQKISGLKNKVMSGMYTVATDIHNLESAIQPMEMKPVTEVIDYYEETYKPELANRTYTYLSPTTKWMIQYENSVGKDDVGIAANAIKADGAIQQRFNMLFAKSGIVPESAKLNLDINLKYGNRQICKRNFVKWANVKCTKDQFIQLCEGKDFTQDLDYLIVQALLEGKEISGIDEKTVNSVTSDWKLFTDLYGAQDLSSYIDFLWFRTNFENNAADYESIFISLSTDNAKELALARLHANPDLMSMPLAMVALGMDINQVVDTCVNLIDIIAKDLEANRFTSNKKKDVRKIIREHTGKEFDQATGASLLAIYNVAQEMRTITSFFKVNQGITANYSDLLRWIDGLSKSKVDRDKSLSDEEKLAIPENLQKYIGQKIDFDRLFKDPVYANELQQYCEYTKTGVNYIDIIRTSPHFRAQLQGVQFMTNLIENSSFVAALSKLAMSGFQTELPNVSVDAAQLDGQENADSEESKTHFGEIQDQSLYKKMVQIGYHYAAGKALDALTDGVLGYKMMFKKGDLDSEFPGKTTQDIGMNVTFDLSTNAGINYFVDAIENQFIPWLKETYRDNLFVRALEKERDYETGKTIYGCKYDVFGRTEDLSEADKLNQVIRQFSSIMRSDSMIKTVSKHPLSIGEVMCLYSLITTKDRICAINTILREVSTYSELPKVLDKINAELDAKVQNGELQSIIEDLGGVNKLIVYRNALASNNKSSTGIDLHDGFIMTKLPTKDQVPYEEFKKIIERSIGSTANLKITEDYVGDESSKQLIIKIEITQAGVRTRYTETVSNLRYRSLDEVSLEPNVVQSILNNVTLNTKSVVDFITELNVDGVESVNDYDELSEYLNENISDESKNKVILLDLLKSISGENKVILIKSGTYSDDRVDNSFFTRFETSDKANPLTYLVIKDSALSINNWELIDLLLQLKANSNRQQDKISVLSEILSPDQQDQIEIYKMYLLDQSIDNEYKRLCSAEIDKYATALSAENELLYYQFSNLSSTIKSGDRFEREARRNGQVIIDESTGLPAKEQFLCLGKKRGNKYTFVQTSNIQGSPIVLEVTENGVKYNGLHKIAELKLHQNTVLKTPKKDKNILYSEKAYRDIEELSIGDLVYDFDDEYIVSQIVYEGLNKQLIAYNPETKTQLLFTAKSINSSIVPRYREDLSKSTRAKTSITGKDAIKFVSGLNVLREDDQIIADGKVYRFYQRLAADSILATDGTNIVKLNSSQIDELLLNHTVNFDKEFTLVGTAKTEFIDKNSIKKRYLPSHYLDMNPDFEDNVARSFILLDDNGNYKRYFSDYVKITAKDYNPQISDILVIKTVDEKLYKIANRVDNKYIVYQIDGVHDDKFNVLELSEEDLNNAIVYSRLLESKKQNYRRTIQEGVDIIDGAIGIDILDKLQDTIGLSYRIIKDNTKPTAMLSDDEIIINVAKCPSSMSVGEFISKQALHEFTHLALANLQIHSPETYFALIQYTQRLISSDEFTDELDIWKVINSSLTYDSQTEKLEEYIVRVIENSAKFTEKSDKFIEDSINKGLANLLGVDSNLFADLSKDLSIGGILRNVKSDFFKETAKTFNMNMIRNESVALNMFDNIEKYCK